MDQLHDHIVLECPSLELVISQPLVLHKLQGFKRMDLWRGASCVSLDFTSPHPGAEIFYQ